MPKESDGVKTTAQQQMEYLLDLKRKGEKPAKKWRVLENSPEKERKALVLRTVPLDSGRWAELSRRLAQGEFENEQELWAWAMEWVAALPVGSHRMSRRDKEALLGVIRDWCQARAQGA